MINESTFEFLEALAIHNDREWFQDNKFLYEAARANLIDFTTKIIQKVSDFDPLIQSDLDARDCVFRIYRDIRFSKDKTPYKTHLGIGISPQGKNFKGPGYYIHIQPGNTFITAGSWRPEPDKLKAIRQEIDYSSSDFHSILEAPDFVKLFGDMDREDFLKTVPKGYDAGHPDIQYLKLKSFTASHVVTRSIFTAGNSVEYTVNILRSLMPLIQFLRNAVS